VNSAFEDVLDLCFALDRCGGMQYFGQAIGLYERMRAPQSRAICELIPIGFPQQYNHMCVRAYLHPRARTYLLARPTRADEALCAVPLTAPRIPPLLQITWLPSDTPTSAKTTRA
jgi:hypothetical protein